jgi:hypothetical protein
MPLVFKFAGNGNFFLCLWHKFSNWVVQPEWQPKEKHLVCSRSSIHYLKSIMNITIVRIWWTSVWLCWFNICIAIFYGWFYVVFLSLQLKTKAAQMYAMNVSGKFHKIAPQGLTITVYTIQHRWHDGIQNYDVWCYRCCCLHQKSKLCCKQTVNFYGKLLGKQILYTQNISQCVI